MAGVKAAPTAGNVGHPLLQSWQRDALILSALIKLLLVPAYHSTDFEVHRHWLATTQSLPVSQWYFDETSQWTLDYPPYFAYFSWLLGVPARYWDPRIVDLKGGLEYANWPCKLYMRLTVIVTELVFATALFHLSRPSKLPARSRYTLPPWVATALLLHPGLVIVDHVHFQYNGFLYGILLWSIWAAREQRPLLCAFLFSTLLNFKHIYVYIAPAFFVYLLRTYVLDGGVLKSSNNQASVSALGERLFTLGVITALPFAISLGPLLASGLTTAAPAGPSGILAQMLRRLFPFSRGLNHAYWAANAWALYTFADRALAKILKVTHVDSNAGASAATRGIIGDVEFAVLPQVSAGHCFLVTMLCMLAVMARLWRRPNYGAFLQSIALFGLTSFMWGFHVHEKAILLGIIPLTLLSSTSFTLMRMTLLLTVAGSVGLFPLLFGAREVPIKILYSLLWLLATPLASALDVRYAARFPLQPAPTNVALLLHVAENAYIYGFVALEAFVELIHPVLMSRGQMTNVSTASSSPINKLAEGVSSAAAAAAATVLPASALSAASQLIGGAIDATTIDATSYSAAPAAQDKSEAEIQPSASLLSTASTLEFLPLMLTSVYCALGMVWVWLRLGASFCGNQGDEEEQASSTKVAAPEDKTKTSASRPAVIASKGIR